MTIKKKTGAEKKAVTMRFDQAKMKELRHLAVELDRTVTDLVDEGISMILRKYSRGN